MKEYMFLNFHVVPWLIRFGHKIKAREYRIGPNRNVDLVTTYDKRIWMIEVKNACDLSTLQCAIGQCIMNRLLTPNKHKDRCKYVILVPEGGTVPRRIFEGLQVHYGIEIIGVPINYNGQVTHESVRVLGRSVV